MLVALCPGSRLHVPAQLLLSSTHVFCVWNDGDGHGIGSMKKDGDGLRKAILVQGHSAAMACVLSLLLGKYARCFEGPGGRTVAPECSQGGEQQEDSRFSQPRPSY